jgi:hypothetical protein
VPPQDEPVVEDVTPEEIKAYSFAVEYCQCMVDTYPRSHRRSDEEMDNDINGIAALVLQGKINGIREGLERSILNSSTPEQARSLMARLNEMFPPDEAVQESTIATPEPDSLLPDPSKTTAGRNAYGYSQEDMLPLSLDCALELFDAELPVYLLYPDNTEALVFDREEIYTFPANGLCGITKADWENSSIFTEQKAIADEALKKTEVVQETDKPREQAAVVETDYKSLPPAPEATSLSESIKPIDVPVYKHPPEIARENGELEQYRLNNKLNKDCAAAIDKAIADSNYEPFHYDLKTAAKTVLAEYGAERVDWVLANTIQKQHYDGRYSSANKKWAKDFDIPEKASSFFCNAHPTLLDGFIDRKRESMLENPSLLESLKVNEKKSREQYGNKAARDNATPKKDKREEI